MSASAPTSAGPDRRALAGKHFLVVDDHSYMIDVICEILRHYAAEDPARASSVEQAMRNCGGTHFDCIICDFNMKPINGIQWLQAIRAGKCREVPREQAFLLLTGHGDIDVVKAAKALDVSAYVVKPVAPDTFMKAITRALGAPPTLRPQHDYERVPTQNLARLQ